MALNQSQSLSHRSFIVDDRYTIPNTNEYECFPEDERWFRKFIDFDILDPVWFQILRNHPELQVDSDGKQISLPKNHNLKNKFLPEASRYIALSHCASTIIHSNNFITTIESESENVAFYKNYGSENKIGDKFHLRSTNPSPPVGIPVSHQFNASPFIVKATASASFLSSLRIDGVSRETLDFQQRIILISADLFVENLTSDALAAAGKNASKAKGPTVEIKPKTFIRFRLVVLDIYSDLEADNCLCDKIHDFYLPDVNLEYSENLDLIKEIHNKFQVDLAEDCRVMSLVIHESNPATLAICQIYDLAEIQLERVKPSLPEPSAESVEGTEAATTSNSVLELKEPMLMATWKVQATSTNTATLLQRVLIVSPLSSNSSKDSINTKHPTASNEEMPDEEKAKVALASRVNYLSQVKLILILTGVAQLPFYWLAARKEEEAAPVPTGKDAKAAKPAGKGDVEPEKKAPKTPCVVLEVTRWTMSSAITSWDMLSNGENNASSQRDLLALGTANGLVTLWDIRRGLLVDTLGNHSSPISAISGLYDKYTGIVSVVAGATDGTVTLYSNLSLSTINAGVSPLLFPPSLIDFRDDVFRQGVISIKVISVVSIEASCPTNLVLVQYSGSSGLVVYDLMTLKLLGSFGMEERINFHTFVSSPLCASNIPWTAYTPPKDIINPPLPVEPPPAASKGKPGAPAPEPVPVVEPEPVVEPAEPELLVIPSKFIDSATCKELLLNGESLLMYDSIQAHITSRVDMPYSRLFYSVCRDHEPRISIFDLSAIAGLAVRDQAQSAAVMHPNNSVSTISRGVVSTLPGTGQVKSKVSKLRGFPHSSSQTSKLTEERLAAHTQAMKEDNSKTVNEKNSYIGGSWISSEEESPITVKNLTLDPVTVVKEQLFKNKRERLKNSKPSLSKKLSALSALC